MDSSYLILVTAIVYMRVIEVILIQIWLIWDQYDALIIIWVSSVELSVCIEDI